MNKILINVLTELVKLISIQQNHINDQKLITVNQFRIRALNYLIKIIQKHKSEIINTDDIKDYPSICKGYLEKVD